MASHLIASAPWAPGTSVSVYAADAIVAGQDTPTGSPVTSAVVSSGQSVQFTGLAQGVRYLAYAGGVARRFLIPPDDETVTGVRHRVDGLEARLPVVETSSAYVPATAIRQYVTATGDDTADGKSWGKAKATVSAAYAAAVAAGPGSEVVVGPGTFSVPTRVNLQDGVSIRGAGIDRTTLLAVSGIATGVLVGLGADTVSDMRVHALTIDCASLAGINGVQISTGARNVVRRVKTVNVNIGVNLNGTTDSEVSKCRVLNAAAQGIQSAGARNRVEKCVVDTTQDIGISLSAAPDNKILDNRIVAAGISGATKHGINIAAASDRSIVRGNDITPSGGMGISATGSVDLEIVNNEIDNASSTLECIGITSSCAGSVVSGNRAKNGKDNGISVSAKDCTVSANVVSGAQRMGIQINGGRCAVTGNVCKNNGLAAGASPLWAGIDIHACNDNTVTGNVCYDDQGTPTQQFGVVIRDGSADRNVVVGNNVQGNVQAGVALSGAVGTNNVVANNPGDAVATVASAATITLPAGGELVTISGTTTITSVTASWVGRRVTLVFSGILTFTDGGNLKLAGNFVTTADDTISLVYDGANWFETARSVN